MSVFDEIREIVSANFSEWIQIIDPKSSWTKIPGKNEKINKNYIIKTCYIVFPYGKLRLITLVGGWK